MTDALSPALPLPNLGATKMYVVPLPPSWNQRTRFTRHGIYTSGAVEAWEEKATATLRQQGWRRPEIADRYSLAVRLWFPNRRRTDLDKRLNTLMDWLTRLLGVDDSACWSVMIEKGIDKQHPRCELALWEYTAA